MVGDDKYEAYATYVRQATGAAGVVVIVLAGDRGYGMSVQAPPDVEIMLPELLRELAQGLEDQARSVAS